MKAQATTLYPFVPSGPDFPLSIAFFAELGFERLWEHDSLAGLRFGGAYFMLQQHRCARVAEELDDHLRGRRSRRLLDRDRRKGLAQRFSGVSLRPPTDFPWGREMHIIDPGGVCWHVRQAKTS